MKSSNFLLAVFLVLFAQSIAVDFKNKNACTNVKGITNSKDITKLSGHWYRFVHNLKSEHLCMVSNRSFVKNDTGLFQTVAFKIRQLDGSVAEDLYQDIVPETTNGIFKTVHNDGNVQVLYAVLDTDYSTYAVEYMCNQESNVAKEQVWVMTTSMTLTDAVRKKLANAIKQSGLKLKTDEMPESCAGLE